MPSKNDPETLKVPAYMRNKAIVKRDRQRLLWTAWDRKDAGVKPGSKQALGKTKRDLSETPREIMPEIEPHVPGRTRIRKRRVSRLSRTSERSSTKSAVDIEPETLEPKKIACAGEVTHYLDNINVAIIKTTTSLKQGDVLLIEGDDYLFVQPIDEMQIDRKPVKRAKKGSHIGLKVAFEAEVNGLVYKF